MYSVRHNYIPMWLPQWLNSKESACNAGDSGDEGSIPESGRSPGGGNCNPLQHSGQENPTDKGAWWATVHGVAKSQTRLSTITSLLVKFLSLPPFPILIPSLLFPHSHL